MWIRSPTNSFFLRLKETTTRFYQFKSIVGNREGSLLMGVLRKINSRVPAKIYLNNLFLNKNLIFFLI